MARIEELWKLLIVKKEKGKHAAPDGRLRLKKKKEKTTWMIAEDAVMER